MKTNFVQLFFIFVAGLLLVGCTQKAQVAPKHFELPEEALHRDRMPTCDPHPYIYGSDERGHWMSNGCSRKYIDDNSISPKDPGR